MLSFLEFDALEGGLAVGWGDGLKSSRSIGRCCINQCTASCRLAVLVNPSSPGIGANWKQYNAALKSRGSLTVWLDKRGRSPKFFECWIRFCLTLKNLFGMALRQTIWFVESVLHLSGLAWPVLNFSTRCRRQLDLMCRYRTRAARQGYIYW